MTLARNVDYVLDLRGEPCPYPVVFSLETLRKLKKGTVLEILADCPQSFRALPEEVRKAGFKVLEKPQKSGPTLHFFVEA